MAQRGAKPDLAPQAFQAATASTYQVGQTLLKGTVLWWTDADCQVATTTEVVLKPKMQVKVVLVDDPDDVTTVPLAQIQVRRHIK